MSAVTDSAIAASLATTGDVAARLGVSTSTIRYWRHVNYGPPYLKVGRQVRYVPAALEEWIADQARATAVRRGA